jgi:phosphomannomutase/phosphoglucomutase
MAIPSSIFRTYDIRGVITKGFDAAAVNAIGRALGSEALQRGQKRIAIGRDGRLSGPELLTALCDGLLSTGIDVIDIGCVPTPVLYYATHTRADGNGVMLTGSHNPPDYNGLKMILGGETLASEAIQALRQRIEAGDYSSGTGQLSHLDIGDDYIARITGDVKLARPLKVVVDCGNGVAGELAPKLFRALGCEVVELFCEIDGNFPNHHPDPSQPENLHDVIAATAKEQAYLGLAFDGDGDRVGVVTPKGAVIWPDRLMVLYARDVLSRAPGSEIIFDVKCSGNLPRAIAEYGGKPQMWLTGHSLIKKRMQESGAMLAGEMSGHIFFKERWYGFDDGLYAAARLLEILAKESRTADAIFDELPDAINTPELRVEMEEGEHYAYMERLMRRADHFAGAKPTTIDGLRVDYPDGWGLVRASNTTPSLVLRFEGNDQAALERIQNQFRTLMLEIEPGLQLPF